MKIALSQDNPQTNNFNHNHDNNVELMWVCWFYITSKTVTNTRKAFSAVKYTTLYSMLVFTQKPSIMLVYMFWSRTQHAIKFWLQCHYQLNWLFYSALQCHPTMKYEWSSMHIWGQDSSVGIATGYGLDSPGFESQRGQEFSRMSRPALGPTQPPVQWVPGISRG
jgi:hypothetical protein